MKFYVDSLGMDGWKRFEFDEKPSKEELLEIYLCIDAQFGDEDV